MLRDFYNDSKLNAKAWKIVYDALYDGMSDGADKNLKQLDYRDRDYQLFKDFRKNLWMFSGAKIDRLVNELDKFKFYPNGKKKPFNVFSSSAKIRLSRYYTEWLEVEYRMVVANTQSGIRWKNMQNRKKNLPNLRYQTAHDERVRNAHSVLDGVTLPMDDEFWDKFMPPNGWNCRCNVQQTAGGITKPPKVLPDNKDVPPTMRNNSGKTGLIFNGKHPYFLTANEKVVSSFVRDTVSNLPIYDILYVSKKAKVEVHPIVDSKTSAKNMLIAENLADLGVDVQLLSIAKETDALIDKKLTILKNGINGINKAIRGKDALLLVINIDKYDKRLTIKALSSLGDNVGGIKSIWMIIDSKLVKLTESDMQNKKWELLP